jgi:hypothetical protein
MEKSMDDIIDFLYEIKQGGYNSLLCKADLRMREEAKSFTGVLLKVTFT